MWIFRGSANDARPKLREVVPSIRRKPLAGEQAKKFMS